MIRARKIRGVTRIEEEHKGGLHITLREEKCWCNGSWAAKLTAQRSLEGGAVLVLKPCQDVGNDSWLLEVGYDLRVEAQRCTQGSTGSFKRSLVLVWEPCQDAGNDSWLLEVGYDLHVEAQRCTQELTGSFKRSLVLVWEPCQGVGNDS